MRFCSCLLLSLTFQYALGQFAECGSNCIFLKDCPELLALATSGVAENLRQFREATCGFKNRIPKVCCPKIESVSEPISDVVETSEESLLPTNCGNPSSADRIIGGTIAPIDSYPWMAALGYTAAIFAPGETRFVCAGSVINNRYILTAAHCIDKASLNGLRLSVIHLGDWDLSTPVDCQVTRKGQKCNPPHIVAGAEEVIIHPQYNKRAISSDDIGLIRLNVSVDIGPSAYVKAICLPKKGLDVKTTAGSRVPLAAGWGLTEHGNQSNILLRVELPFVDDQKCKDIYKSRYLDKEQLCVGGKANADTCSGDSGAPLILPESGGPPFFQIGVVAYGWFPCARSSIPGVYTSVSQYREWIVSNLKP